MSCTRRSQILQWVCAIGVAVLVIINYKSRKFASSSNSGRTAAISNHLSHDVRFSLPNKSEEKTGYIVALGYGEGYHGRGSAGLINLQCWVQSFNLSMHVVEPMICESYYSGLPINGHTCLRLSEIFDVNHLNKEIDQTNSFKPMAMWNDFLEKAPRNIVFVKFIKLSRNDKPGSYVNWDVRGLQSKDQNSCKQIEDLQHFFKNKSFCVVKFVSTVLDSNYPFTEEDFYNVILKNWKQEEVTLIFNVWSLKYRIRTTKADNPKFCQSVDQYSFYPPSLQVLQAVKKYEKLYLHPITSVAVMIRSEHFLLSLGYLKKNAVLLNQTIYAGLNQLVTITRNLLSKLPRGKLFVTVDVGKYGSSKWLGAPHGLGFGDSSTSHLIKAIKNLVPALYSNSLSFEEWDDRLNTVTGGNNDQTYRSVLEMSIAVRAKCLILFGGGTFQLLSLHEYLHNHPTKSEQCWKFLGVQRNFHQQYAHLLANYSGMKIDDLDLPR